MEEKIQEKINALVVYIVSMPVESLTMDDYMILSSELKDARFRREQGDSNDKLTKLLASFIPSAVPAMETKPMTQTVRTEKK